MKLTKNFSLSEFACKDGTTVPYQYMPNVQELANNLQVLRDYLQRRGDGLGLRLGVKKTGCSGFAYVVNYADEIGDAVAHDRDAVEGALRSLAEDGLVSADDGAFRLG